MSLRTIRIRSAGQECPTRADSDRQKCLPHQTQISGINYTYPEIAHTPLRPSHFTVCVTPNFSNTSGGGPSKLAKATLPT